MKKTRKTFNRNLIWLVLKNECKWKGGLEFTTAWGKHDYTCNRPKRKYKICTTGVGAKRRDCPMWRMLLKLENIINER